MVVVPGGTFNSSTQKCMLSLEMLVRLFSKCSQTIECRRRTRIFFYNLCSNEATPLSSSSPVFSRVKSHNMRFEIKPRSISCQSAMLSLHHHAHSLSCYDQLCKLAKSEFKTYHHLFYSESYKTCKCRLWNHLSVLWSAASPGGLVERDLREKWEQALGPRYDVLVRYCH